MSEVVMALMGAGEFEAWCEPVDRWLLERARKGDGSVLVLPTASAPEGDETYSMWSGRGIGHYQRLGLPAEVLPLKTREDCFDETLIARLRDASMVFFSGGNPLYLARTLVDTPFWAALQEEIARGLAYAGCSAGACYLGTVAPDSSSDDLASPWHPGIGYFPDANIGPHWDKLDEYIPGLRNAFVNATAGASTFVGIDEATAILGDGRTWTVAGAGSASLRIGTEWHSFTAGTSFEAALLPTGAGV